jgi:hypothetical protein|tara:strand:+ start:129 stop:278 length:150 start_codon:yes stop_codon:yes gene_type:complete
MSYSPSRDSEILERLDTLIKLMRMLMIHMEKASGMVIKEGDMRDGTSRP